MKVLIGTTVHQEPATLAQYLRSLTKLISKAEIDYCFVDDNEAEESSALLTAFQKEHPAVLLPSLTKSSYQRDDYTHYWTEKLIWKVAHQKNKIIEQAVVGEYDYLFLVDSDLILHPQTLSQLLLAEKDIISNIFWTKWQPDSQPLPQVWIQDEYIQYNIARSETLSEEEKALRQQQFLAQMQQPGVYEVGGLGACTLISRNALRQGVHFGEISNLSFWGEDRHFCIRAAALGFKLFVDTHYPAYHIYREEDLHHLASYQTENGWPNYFQRKTKKRDNKLTLSMIVKNEADRYLRDVLQHLVPVIDEAVIIDDHSSDDTVALCRELLQNIPHKIIENPNASFDQEVELRKLQWEETIQTNPDWILCLDADEIPESRFADEIESLLNQEAFDAYSFRLYDFWDKEHYREDEYWQAHHYYRPFLVRYQPDFTYTWQETPVHCGRLPNNIFQLPNALSSVRVKHFGWAREADRLRKYQRYLKHDPDAQYGSKAQYESILDAAPALKKWTEVSSS